MQSNNILKTTLRDILNNNRLLYNRVNYLNTKFKNGTKYRQ